MFNIKYRLRVGKFLVEHYKKSQYNVYWNYRYHPKTEKSLACKPNHDKFIQGYYSFILAAVVLGFKLHITSLQYNKYWVFGQFM